MEDHGERLQYSVFLCDLTVAELAELESAVTEVMSLHEDSVVQIDLWPLHAPAAVRTSGARGAFPYPVHRSCDGVASGPVRRQSPVTARMHVSDHPTVFSRSRPCRIMPTCWQLSHEPVPCLLRGPVFPEP